MYQVSEETIQFFYDFFCRVVLNILLVVTASLSFFFFFSFRLWRGGGFFIIFLCTKFPRTLINFLIFFFRKVILNTSPGRYSVAVFSIFVLGEEDANHPYTYKNTGHLCVSRFRGYYLTFYRFFFSSVLLNILSVIIVSSFFRVLVLKGSLIFIHIKYRLFLCTMFLRHYLTF